MSISQRLVRWGGLRLSRRLSRSVPFLGTAIVVATVGGVIRRKGVVGGIVDSGLNAIPFVGGLKIALESIRGRDLISDRTSPIR